LTSSPPTAIVLQASAKKFLGKPPSLFPGASPRADLLTTETAPENKREKSAKKPIKSLPFAPNTLENQSDSKSEKTLAKNRQVGRESAAPPAVRQPAAFDADKDYQEYLQEKAAAENQLRIQTAADNQALETQNSELETPIPEAPKPRKQFLHPIEDAEEYNYAITHGHRREDRPAYIPDRRWEEDFGNPRKIKGCY
jgi:hypothetical protein